jgi:phosphohistidine phosphatase
MKLYLVRHGKAQAADGTVEDSLRQLTPDGIKRLETEAQALARIGIDPAHIFSSPRVRAQQTAEIIANALHKTVEIREEVNYDFDVNAIATLIQGVMPDAEVMFVGHEPTMSDAIYKLTGANVVMKVGSLARVDIDSSQADLYGQLVWLLAPRVFDGLAD